ncbi:ATP-dependent zinc protease family protein [Photobacterium nomapromontoriensis]|uniref:ATP-dependent zinc protease family protein n=1 Tax=Photobacterium nomapromontoriensis TaxID=2910237 RepID=UPI003D137617
MSDKMIVGWRETLSLPSLGINRINAKIDTGARTSSLHAFKCEEFTKNNVLWLRFWTHPEQHRTDIVQTCEAEIIDQRAVKSSSGQEAHRYVIKTTMTLGGQTWPIEITIANRDKMAYRMLLGRTAMHGRIIVDPEQSFLIACEESDT